MSMPPDPFGEWPPPGMEEALDSFEDDAKREAMRTWIRSLEGAQEELPALADQPDMMRLFGATWTLDEMQARATLVRAVMAIWYLQDPDGWFNRLRGTA